jgi:IS30 family transposase
MKKVEWADAEPVAMAVIDIGKPHEDKIKTTTYDNGREFAAHAKMAMALGAAIYFAKPCHSWERGLNENTNGLIRQYMPKKAMLADSLPDDIVDIQETINNRPRKPLGYLMPHEVFIERKIRVEKCQGYT